MEMKSVQYGQCGPNVLLRSPPSSMTLSEERGERALWPHVTCIEDIAEAFRPCYGPGFSSMSLTHLRSEAGLDVGLDSGETEKATLAGLGCGMGVERLPSVCSFQQVLQQHQREKL